MESKDRVSQQHSDMFMAMLKIKYLPEALVEKYLEMKSVTDRIDGHLRAGDMYRIAIDAGYNTKTGIFDECANGKGKVKVIAGEMPKDIVDNGAGIIIDLPTTTEVDGQTELEESVNKTVEEEKAEDVENGEVAEQKRDEEIAEKANDGFDAKVADGVVEPKADLSLLQSASDTLKKNGGDSVGNDEPIPTGTLVTYYTGDEIIEGRIVSSGQKPDKTIVYIIQPTDTEKDQIEAPDSEDIEVQ